MEGCHQAQGAVQSGHARWMQADGLGFTAIDGGQPLAKGGAGRVAIVWVGGRFLAQSDGGLPGTGSQAGVLPERLGSRSCGCIHDQTGQPLHVHHLAAARGL